MGQYQQWDIVSGVGLTALAIAAGRAAHALLRTVTQLSASGSRIAIEHLRNIAALRDDPALRQHAIRRGIDFAALIPHSAGHDSPTPEQWLSERGWSIDSDRVDTVASHYGRGFAPFIQTLDPADYRFVTARIPETDT